MVFLMVSFVNTMIFEPFLFSFALLLIIEWE